MDRNYQKELDGLIEVIKTQDRVPKLLLHSCCAPCSSYVLEYLSQYFKILVFFYNPNIDSQNEYKKRVIEQQRLIDRMKFVYPVTMVEGSYSTEEFYSVANGFESDEEGGSRCFRCYELRLRESVKVAEAGNFDYFTTTLSISPMKNAAKLNEIGENLGKEYGIPYLVSDFKKKDGYRRSIELSKEYGLYRQDYCGCVFSRDKKENK